MALQDLRLYKNELTGESTPIAMMVSHRINKNAGIKITGDSFMTTTTTITIIGRLANHLFPSIFSFSQELKVGKLTKQTTQPAVTLTSGLYLCYVN